MFMVELMLYGIIIFLSVIGIILAIMSIISVLVKWYLEWLDYRSKRKYKHVMWLKSMGLLETGIIIYHMNSPYHESFDRIEE